MKSLFGCKKGVLELKIWSKFMRNLEIKNTSQKGLGQVNNS